MLTNNIFFRLSMHEVLGRYICVLHEEYSNFLLINQVCAIFAYIEYLFKDNVIKKLGSVLH